MPYLVEVNSREEDGVENAVPDDPVLEVLAGVLVRVASTFDEEEAAVVVDSVRFPRLDMEGLFVSVIPLVIVALVVVSSAVVLPVVAVSFVDDAGKVAEALVESPVVVLPTVVSDEETEVSVEWSPMVDDVLLEAESVEDALVG
jgi:hypothetical protein